MLKNPSWLSFRGAAGDEESRKSFVFRARFLASLGMTSFTEVFQHPARRGPRILSWPRVGGPIRRLIRPLTDYPRAATGAADRCRGALCGRPGAGRNPLFDPEQAFRLIVLPWQNPQPSLFGAGRHCYHVVATNREESAQEVVWKHNQRGESENWHKELKVGYGMEVATATPAGSWRPMPCILPLGC